MINRSNQTIVLTLNSINCILKFQVSHLKIALLLQFSCNKIVGLEIHIVVIFDKKKFILIA